MIPGLGRSAGEGKGYLLLYSGLENSRDYTAHGVPKSGTRLSLSFSLVFLPQTKAKTTKGHKETFGGNGHVYYLDCGACIMGICMSQTHQIVISLTREIFFLYQLSINKILVFLLGESHQ